MLLLRQTDIVFVFKERTCHISVVVDFTWQQEADHCELSCSLISTLNFKCQSTPNLSVGHPGYSDARKCYKRSNQPIEEYLMSSIAGAF